MAIDTVIRTRRLLGHLLSYQANFELMCVAVASGGRRIALEASLPALCDEYAALLGSRGEQAMQLVVAHRGVIKLLCQLRTHRGCDTRDLRHALHCARARHWAAVCAMVAQLRRQAGLQQSR